MQDADAERFVIHLVKTVLPGNEKRTVSRDMDLVTDLGADSMSLVSLIFSLDEKLGVGTEELGGQIQQCRTVDDVIAMTLRLSKPA
jgi:acyl carrier protein